MVQEMDRFMSRVTRSSGTLSLPFSTVSWIRGKLGDLQGDQGQGGEGGVRGTGGQGGEGGVRETQDRVVRVVSGGREDRAVRVVSGRPRTGR